MMKMFKKKTRVLNAELPRPLQRNAMSTLYANLGFMSFDKPMRTIVGRARCRTRAKRRWRLSWLA